MSVDRIIDCDIHHDWPSQEALYPYLSEGWREYVLAPTRAGLPAIPLIQTQVCPNPNGATQRPDTFPENGGAAASDPALMREQLLEPFRIERGLLTYGQGFFTGATPNPYFASEIARASNDYTIDHWLGDDDDRLYGTIMLAARRARRRRSRAQTPRRPPAHGGRHADVKWARKAVRAPRLPPDL